MFFILRFYICEFLSLELGILYKVYILMSWKYRMWVKCFMCIWEYSVIKLLFVVLDFGFLLNFFYYKVILRYWWFFIFLLFLCLECVDMVLLESCWVMFFLFNLIVYCLKYFFVFLLLLINGNLKVIVLFNRNKC